MGQPTAKQEFVTVRIAKQLMGIAVLDVQDVLSAQKITPVPLAPDWIAGVLNLRGRIVTAIDLRRRLGLPCETPVSELMSVVVESKGEPYSLVIEEIGDVISVDQGQFDQNPVTLSPQWSAVSQGVYRLDNELMIVLDVEQIFLSDVSSRVA